MPTLYTRTSNSITLEDALKNCASVLSNGCQGIALLYSPTCCQFAKVQPDGTLTDAKEEALDLKNVFEARVFNKNCELRWLNELNGEGRAVLLSQENITEYLAVSIPNLEALDTILQNYLLWGKGVENSSSSGWGRLSAARIGSTALPAVMGYS